MDTSTEQFILNIINHGKDLTVANIRPDGYPQATAVSYAHVGMTISVDIEKESQKAKNTRNNNKVPMTINEEYEDWNHIKGCQLAARRRSLIPQRKSAMRYGALSSATRNCLQGQNRTSRMMCGI